MSLVGSLCKRTPAVRSQSPRTAGVRVEPNTPHQRGTEADLPLSVADRREPVHGSCGKNFLFFTLRNREWQVSSADPTRGSRTADTNAESWMRDRAKRRACITSTGRDSGLALARPVLTISASEADRDSPFFGLLCTAPCNGGERPKGRPRARARGEAQSAEQSIALPGPSFAQAPAISKHFAAGLRALAPRQPPALVFKWMDSISRESFVHAVFLGVTREANIRSPCCCLVVVWLRQ